MKNFFGIAAFVAGTNALVGRSDSCCFQITASGGASGTLGQLSDGQVRVGDTTLSAATFCLEDAIITDSNGRGCVVTSEYHRSYKYMWHPSLTGNIAETTQFQCDEGATGTSGFTLSSSGALSFDGSSSFMACATGQDNGDNIYTTNSTSVTQCVSVELTSDSCYAAVSSSAVASSSTPFVIPASIPPVSSSAIPSGVGAIGSSTPVPVTSMPVPSGTPVPVSSTPVATSTPLKSTPVTTSSFATSTTTASVSETSSTASSSAAATTAPSSSATKVDFSNWGASLVAMLALAVAY
ncbi:hypothetical protein N7448_009715 [Penicillium atrosanguineum]|uniref:Cell wall mannoprotein PIR1-like C-terminal domain-containing protein n=1 Tax=Penicillium atrosanguineum TaxID=1132637 RepID=A0A9W9GL37_9EURO|nr:hypothetical protein N7448_009715 [Penicillium atrosanguineum]KAJ5320892.1 hypothetical protein N7476_003894 [Penicillium atrosanguineum]